MIFLSFRFLKKDNMKGDGKTKTEHETFRLSGGGGVG